MGSSFSGNLVYGIEFDLDYIEERDIDWGELSAEWEKERRPKQPEDKGDYRTPEWDEWREKFCEWQATPENVCFDFTGDLEYRTKYMLHCKCLEKEADWGSVIPIDAGMMTVDTSQHDAYLKEFCEQYDLPYSQPKWFLTSQRI